MSIEQQLAIGNLEKLGEAMATIARLTTELAEARAEVERLNRPATANPTSLTVEEIGSMRKWLDKTASQTHGSNPEYRHSMVAIQHINEQSAELADLRKRVAGLEKVAERVSWVYGETTEHFDANGRLKGTSEWRINKIVEKLKSLFAAYDELVQAEQALAARREQEGGGK